jgi:hypothetical protein
LLGYDPEQFLPKQSLKASFPRKAWHKSHHISRFSTPI